MTCSRPAHSHPLRQRRHQRRRRQYRRHLLQRSRRDQLVLSALWAFSLIAVAALVATFILQEAPSRPAVAGGAPIDTTVVEDAEAPMKHAVIPDHSSTSEAPAIRAEIRTARRIINRVLLGTDHASRFPIAKAHLDRAEKALAQTGLPRDEEARFKRDIQLARVDMIKASGFGD